MIGLVAAIFTATQLQAPAPPYRRVATELVSPPAFEPAVGVSGNYFFNATQGTCAAYDLAQFKRLWTCKLPKGEQAHSLCAGNKSVYVLTESNNLYAERNRKPVTSHILCIDQRTGAILWRTDRIGRGSAIAIAGSLLFASLRPFTASAIDISTHKAIWTTKLGPHGNEETWEDQIKMIAAGSGAVAVYVGRETYGLAAKSGKVLWTQPGPFIMRGQFASTTQTVWVPGERKSVGISLATGKQVWRSTIACGDTSTSCGSLFVGLSDGEVTALNSGNGQPVWSHRLGPSGTFSMGQSIRGLGDKIFVRGVDRACIYDLHGKELWSDSSKAAYPPPYWTDGSYVVSFDGQRLIRYAHGAEVVIPATSQARIAMAKSLVSRFDELDDQDKKRIEQLSVDAFQPVLKAFLGTCSASDAAGDTPKSYAMYEKLKTLGDILSKITTKGQTQDLITALSVQKVKSSAKPVLLALLVKYGEPKEITPYFLKELQQTKTPGFEMYESNTYIARQYVINSTDPRAVAFMLQQLKDPKGDATLRFEGYVNLARTGGTEGLKAVLAMRNRRTLLRPLLQRVTTGYLNAGEFGAGTKVLAERQDSGGRHWGLLRSGVLGNAGDLWLGEKISGKWAHVWFTGVSDAKPGRWKPAIAEPTIGGKNAADLVAGAWFTVLLANKEIRKDTDGDGLTDIEEKRLGTNPNKADTDSDGDNDGVDPWPNASGEAKTDLEKVLAATFEARYHFDNSEGPAILDMPAEMRPFELPGRKGPTLWRPSNHPEQLDALQRCYENGVALISFYSDIRDKDASWEQKLVTWNKDHTEATLSISTYFGGLNGTGYQVVVRKFGDDWVVVSLRLATVS